MSEPLPEARVVPDSDKRPRREWLSWSITVAVLLTLGAILWLLPHPALPRSQDNPQRGAVSITDAHLIEVRNDTPFAKRLRTATARTTPTEQPVIEVTGSVLAAVPTAAKTRSAAWEFASADLITTYSEWLQSGADVAFYQSQLANTRSLTAKRLETQGAVVDRLQRLVEVGSDSPRDLAQERANLMERKLESDRQFHEAQANLNSSMRHHVALERQLEQSGLEPALLKDLVPGRVLIVAEVPETRMNGLKEGQRCSVRLYAAPETALTGHVARVLPTLSTTQRTLRLLVMLDEPTDAVRPGMFADVGIGTESRSAIMVPQTAIVHVGKDDYVLVEAAPGAWRVTSVELGASQGDQVEVTRNVAAGASVLADGVVLLKPMVADVLRAESLL